MLTFNTVFADFVRVEVRLTSVIGNIVFGHEGGKIKRVSKPS